MILTGKIALIAVGVLGAFCRDALNGLGEPGWRGRLPARVGARVFRALNHFPEASGPRGDKLSPRPSRPR